MVVIFLGSKSNLDWGKEIGKNLDSFGIEYKMHIVSAHKTPEYLLSLLQRYEKLKPPKVYICVAGRSNALGGMVDANVSSPVINCPPYSEKYGGLDILSSLRMPSGVAPLTILEPDQVALSAAKILGLSDKQIKRKISSFQKEIKQKVIEGDQKLSKR